MIKMLKAMNKAKAGMNIPLMKPILDKEMKNAAIEAMEKERLVLGESVYRFEEEFAKYCGVEHAVSTSNGTNALHFSLIALGFKRGDRVVTTPASFIATANAVLHANATPVFADVDLKTYNIDPEKMKKDLSSDSRGVIPVHLYGYPADMDSINEVAEHHGIHVIEDACQAHGAVYKGRRAGSLGDVACFSFYPSKGMMVAGDGGMVVTDDDGVAETVAKLRDCGRRSKYTHDLVGYTARLNTVNAAIGRVQLRHLDEWNGMRRKNAELYDRLLSDIDELILPPSGNSDVKPVYHLYVIRTRYRGQLRSWLESQGIECGFHYVLPIHLQPVYRELYGYEGGEYPNSEELCRTCLSIPLFPYLKEDEIRYISEKIHVFFYNRLHEKRTD